MNTTAKRIVINGGLVVGGLLVFGIMFGQIAGMWVASQVPQRLQMESIDGAPTQNNDELTTQIKWRVPIMMASMGFGLVVVFELLGSLWRPKKAVESTPKTTISDDELQMQRLLKEAEQNPHNTPSPVGTLKSEAVAEA